jgi:hypothetical protein
VILGEGESRGLGEGEDEVGDTGEGVICGVGVGFCVATGIGGTTVLPIEASETTNNEIKTTDAVRTTVKGL